MSQLGLSICIIAKNEEKFIAECLKSAMVIADLIPLQIVLVDTGSIDNTISIVKNSNSKSLNVEIYQFNWVDDFSAARNYAISKAKYSHILILDADEEIIFSNEIIELIKNDNSNSAWLINVESFAEKNNSTDYFNSMQFRLFRNLPQIKFKGIIHEQITDSIEENNLKFTKTTIKILHKGYNLSDSEMKQKHLRNLNLLLKSLNQKNDNTDYINFQIGKTYLALDNYLNAEKHLLSVVDNPNCNNLTKQQALNYLVSTNLKLSKKESAIKYANLSLEILPNQTFANFLLGDIYLSENKYDLAITYLLNALSNSFNKNDLNILVGDFSVSENLLRFKIGLCYVELKEAKKAKEQFTTAIVKFPNDINNILGLVKVYLNANKLDDALIWLKKANRIAPERNDVIQYISQIESSLNIKPEINKTFTNTTSEIIKEQNENEILVSLCMIVKNEENMLSGCLDSVKDFVDEIIIVDTGSEDNTVEIANKYNAKVHHFQWINDFAAVRNEAISHAKGKWILYLDADERIKYPDFQHLRNMLINIGAEVGGLICNIVSVHKNLTGDSETHKGGYPRLFRNLGFPKIKFTGRVHEQITPSLRDNGLELAFTDIEIEHLGYNVSVEVMEAKVKRNYTLLLEHVKDAPLDGYAWYQLGQTLAQMNLNSEAENCIRFAIDNCKLSDSIYSSACSTLANIVGNKKNFEESLYWADKSLSKAPNQIYSLTLKGFSLLNLNRNKEALEVFEKALFIKEGKQNIPSSGFDIDLDINVIQNGINKAKTNIDNNINSGI